MGKTKSAGKDRIKLAHWRQACREVLPVIKFSKNLLFNPAKIQAFGIRCSFNNIAKILNAFNCKWTVVTIDSAAEGSTLLTFIKNQGLECFTKPRADGCLEVSAVIQYSSLEEFLNKAAKNVSASVAAETVSQSVNRSKNKGKAVAVGAQASIDTLIDRGSEWLLGSTKAKAAKIVVNTVKSTFSFTFGISIEALFSRHHSR